MKIETVRCSDAPALLALRNHYIAHSFATFDEAPLRLAAVQDWIAGFVARTGGRSVRNGCNVP